MHEITIGNVRDYIRDGKVVLPENAVLRRIARAVSEEGLAEKGKD